MGKFRFGSMSVPNRVFKGIYEITKFVHELIGEDVGNDLSSLPDKVLLKAVYIEAENPAISFSAASDTLGDKPIFIQFLSKDNFNPMVLLHCGNDDAEYISGNSSFDMVINPVRDIRRIEEFINTVKSNTGEEIKQEVIVVHLENMGIRVYILKEGKVCEAPADTEKESLRAGLDLMTRIVADLTKAETGSN